MSSEKTIAMVTGATAGLGEVFCRQLASRCDAIIAVGRRLDRLEALANSLQDTVEVHCVVADLASIEGVARSMEALRQKGPVSILINNAGFSPYGHFADLSIDAQRGMVDVHIDASITLCRAAVPFMREMGRGSIINVSSLGSFMPRKGLSVYGGSKVFLNYFSQALHAELSDAGIEVQALCPGYVRTEFHQTMPAQGFDPALVPDDMWMQPEEVVACSLEALGSGQVIVIPGAANREMARAALQAQLDALENA